jgi:hypothetical protein
MRVDGLVRRLTLFDSVMRWSAAPSELSISLAADVLRAVPT